MARLLKGAEVTSAMYDKIKAEVKRLNQRNVFPSLGILRVGEHEDDIYYEKSIIKCCASSGVLTKQYILENDVTQEKLIDTIHELNSDAGIHGILMFRPLPKQLDENAACQAISPDKDVDGVTEVSLANVYSGGRNGFPPCTPQACMEILDYYKIDCKGKKAVVIGRSLVVGKPASMMLLDRNATVTICHTKTVDLPSVCREAEILIAAVGRPEVITKEYLCSGQVVIDVGINVKPDGKICGDAAFEEAEQIVAAITPVPGGVGTVTTAVLVRHVVEAASRSIDK